MMAGIFLLLTLVIFLLYLRQRTWGMGVLIVTLTLAALMLWYHMTSTLQINW